MKISSGRRERGNTTVLKDFFFTRGRYVDPAPAASAAAFVESVFILRTTGLLITGVAPSVVNLPYEDLHPTRIGAATLSAETY